MRTILFVLYILTAVPVIESQQGISRWFSLAFFAFLAWVARKEEQSIERAEERRHEEIVELLRDIKLNQTL